MKLNLVLALGLFLLPSCGTETPQFRNGKNFAFLETSLASYEDATGHLPHDLGAS